MRDLEAGARPRRRLLEHHPQHAARAGSACGVPADAQLAQLLGAPDQRLDAAVGNIPEAEEVTALLVRRRVRRIHAAHLASPSTRSRISIASSISAFADYQGWHQTNDVGAGHGDQQAGRPRPRDHIRRITVDDQPLQQAPPARAARLGAPPLGQPQQRGAEVSAHLAAVIEQAQLVDRVLDVQRRGGRERVAAERRRVGARLEAARDLLVGQHRADRYAARQPLGQRHDVGDDALPLERVEGARPPGPRLDLVEDQHRARVGAGAPQLLQVAGRRQVDAALGLDRLDDDRGGARRRSRRARPPRRRTGRSAPA